MSRNSDIAKILGRTEAANASNTALGTGSGGGSTTVYDSIGVLPLSDVTEGSMAFVNSNNRMYVHNGTGWYSSSIVNNTPTWTTEPLSQYSIIDSATPLVISAMAADSEGIPITYTGIASDSSQYLVTITSDSSSFTFTPKASTDVYNSATLGDLADSQSNSFTYTFRASDGVNILSKQTTILYNIEFGQWLLGYGSNSLYSDTDISNWTYTMAIHGGLNTAAAMFDNDAGTQFHGASGSTGYIQFRMPGVSGTKVTKYHVYERRADNNSGSINDQMRVTGYTLRGSNDGTNWTILHTADEGVNYTRAPKPNLGSNNTGTDLWSTLNGDGTPTIGTEFTINSPNFYLYYRLSWDTVQHYGIMGAWALFGEAS